MTLNGLLAERTLGLRHSIVKLLAPRVYRGFMEYYGLPRPMIKFVSSQFGSKPLVGVEIGVAQGKNAESILQTLNIKKLFLIDPYIPYFNHKGELCTRYVNTFPIAQKRLERFRDKVVFLHMGSEKAHTKVPFDLDFVHIDGNHSYIYVKNDIENYFPKVRKGGVLGGHDFGYQFFDVIKAVTEFANSHGLKLHVLFKDWWIIKNG